MYFFMITIVVLSDSYFSVWVGMGFKTPAADKENQNQIRQMPRTDCMSSGTINPESGIFGCTQRPDPTGT